MASAYQKISRKQAVFLQLCFPTACAHSDYILKELGVPAFFDALRKGAPPVFLQKREIARIQKVNRQRVEEILAKVDADGQKIICFGDADYPEELLHISCSPICLYAKGNTRLLQDRLRICMVGSRRISDYALVTAGNLSYQLALAGVVVVSGLARGTDGAAHTGALAAGGDTISVSACGLDQPYPEKNVAMANAISQRGLRLSEYPPGTRPERQRFPVRNRILSALCQGTVMVEAGLHSGAMITAADALEQGKDVFTLPNSIYDDNAQGNLRLLKDGAKPVSCAGDILEEYAHLPVFQTLVQLQSTRKTPLSLEMLRPLRDLPPLTAKEREQKAKAKEKRNAKKQQVASGKVPAALPATEPMVTDIDRLFAPPAVAPVVLSPQDLIAKGLSQNAVLLYQALQADPLPLAELAEPLELPFSAAITAITQLELQGLVASFPGRRYGRVQ